MHPRKFIRDSFAYAFSQYLVRATLMLRGLIAARLLGPELYGGWNAIQIMMDYGGLAPLGTQQGLDQMVPPRIVAGDAAALARVKRAALFNIALTSGLFALGCLLFGQFGTSRLLHAWGPLGIAAAMVCAVTTNLAWYQTSIMRSHGDIMTASVWIMVQGAIGGILGLVLVPQLHAWGLLLGWWVGCVAAFAYSSVRSRSFAPMLPAPAAESGALLRVGLPMFVFTATSLVMRNLDRLLILHFLSTDALGYYSLSVMALTFLLYLPDSVSYVLYPQLLRRYGETQDPASIRPRVERVLRASSIAVSALSGLAYVFARGAVIVLLPKFLPGVGAMRVLCFGAVGLAFANFASIVLMTLGRQMLLLPLAVVSVVLYAALDLTAIRLHGGITGVAWGTLTAYAINSALLLWAALRGLGHSRGSTWGWLGRLFAPMLLALGLAVALERFLPLAGDVRTIVRVGRVLLASVMFAVGYLVLVRPLTRGLGLHQLVSEVELPVIGGLLRRLTGSEPGQ